LLAIAMALAVMIGGAGAPSVDRALRVRRSPADRTLP
jgi:hypothetical protein